MNYKVLSGIRSIQKAKPNFLKSSYLKNKLADFIFKRWLKKYKKTFKPLETNKVLVVSMKALGDNVVKAASFKIMAEKYGKENLYIMCRDKWSSVFQELGYNVLEMKKLKNPFKNAKYKIDFFKKLNSLGFKEVILFEFEGTEEVLEAIMCDNKIGIYNEKQNPYMKRVVQIDYDDTYILDRQIFLLKELFKEEFTRDEIRPDIREMFQGKKYSNIISIGIGASSERKTMPVKNMGDILKMLLKRYPNDKIILLGSGKKQEDYAKKLIDYCETNRVESFVGKVSLVETIRVINDSEFFLGYDSGLSNVAFSLRKKYICLFWTDMTTWEHPFSDLRIIKGDKKDPINDGYHGTDILNSIKVEQIEKALLELKL